MPAPLHLWIPTYYLKHRANTSQRIVCSKQKERSELTPDAATLQGFFAHKKRELATLDGEFQYLLDRLLSQRWIHTRNICKRKQETLVSRYNHHPHNSYYPPDVHQTVEKPGRTRNLNDNVIGKMILLLPVRNFVHSYRRRRAHRRKITYLCGQSGQRSKVDDLAARFSTSTVRSNKEPEESIDSEGPAPDLCFFDLTLPPMEEESRARSD
ncbi:hypothetical protein HID58_066597 [Brassica napus]|uniref:Uncharacterized protein n=1 Tax=Brassica napus TaxID=3708 RepID=A0ABQ7ZGK5_BRANA|nr:hypothetical protein HID58_066597 [Brassica napus]